MLDYRLLRNSAGITLIGDYITLKALGTVLHEVNNKSPVRHLKDGPTIWLAYDVRKAYEQQREVISAPKLHPEIGQRFGVKALWPVLLVQSKMLRYSMSFIETTKQQQAIAYSLEATIESALEEEFGEQAGEIIHQWENISFVDKSMDELVSSRAAIFSSWKKSQRRKHLHAVLWSLSPMYSFAYEMRLRAGDKTLISPEEFDSWIGKQWDEPK